MEGADGRRSQVSFSIRTVVFHWPTAFRRLSSRLSSLSKGIRGGRRQPASRCGSEPGLHFTKKAWLRASYIYSRAHTPLRPSLLPIYYTHYTPAACQRLGVPAPVRHAALPMVDRLAHRPGSSFFCVCVCVTVCASASASFACSGSIVHAEGASRPCWRSRARARRPGPSAWRLRPPPAAGLGLWGLLAGCMRAVDRRMQHVRSFSSMSSRPHHRRQFAGRPCSAVVHYKSLQHLAMGGSGGGLIGSGRSPTGGVHAKGELQPARKKEIK